MNYSKRAQKKFILVLFLVGFLMGLGVDLYVPSLPAITKHFNISQSAVQMTISLYMLGYGIAQIFLGVLSDSLGRKKILLISSFIYTLVSFCIVISNNIIFLNIFRLLQGISIAGLAVVARAMAVDCFLGKDLAKATSYFGLSWSLGPILGPFIGSYLQTYFNWQANFYFFGIYGMILFLIVLFKIPETNMNFVPFNLILVYKNIKTVSFDTLFLFITIVGGFGYSLIVVFNIVGPFLIQTMLNYSVVIYGYIALILGFTYFLGCVVNRIIIAHIKIDIVLKISSTIAFLSSISMLLLSIMSGLELIYILPNMIVILFCCGFIIPCSLAKTMSIFPQSAGTASSVFGSLSGIIVGVVTMGASFLKTTTQFPMTLTYSLLLLINLLLLICYRKIETKNTL